MSEETRKDIRALLKRFGIRADEAIIQHLATQAENQTLQLRCTLEDRTDYGDAPPQSPLSGVVEGQIGDSDST